MDVKKSILIIDDDLDFLAVIRKRVEDLGHRMVTQEDYSLLPQLFESNNIFLILLDLKFNDEFKGFKFLTNIREKFSKSVPIVILSAETSTSIIAHTLELGANEYVKKPIYKDQFSELINNYLNQSNNRLNDLVYTKINTDSRKINLSINLKLQEINHSGFVFYSEYLITKGTSIKIAGSEVKEIFDKDSINVYVIKNDLVEGQNIGFNIVTEVDSYDTQKLEQLKIWLSKTKTGKLV